MATLYTDDFNRANENPITGWTTAVTAMKIVSNVATSTAGANDNFSFINGASSMTAQWSQVTLTASDSSSGGGPAVRMAASRMGYNAYVYATSIDITRDGSTSLGSTSRTRSFSDVLLLEMNTTTPVLKINGATVLTGTSDSTYSSGSPGIGCWENSTSGVTTLDTWSAGDFSSSGSVPKLTLLGVGAIRLAAACQLAYPLGRRKFFQVLAAMFHPIRKLCIAMLLLAASGGSAEATPSISGQSGGIAHGDSLTLTGSGFGTKSIAGPMLYDDFDDGAVSDDVESRAPQIHQGGLSSYSTWAKDGGGDYGAEIIRLNATSLKARSSKHARMTFDDSAFYGLNLYVPYTFATGNELFISFYYRYTKTGAAYPRQTKAWVAYDGSWGDHAYFSTAFGNCEGGGWRQHRTDISSDIEIGLDGPDINGEWVRFESYLKQSSASTGNGAWTARVYRPTIGTPDIIENIITNAVMRGSSTNWTKWTFGGGYYSMCGSSDFGTVDVDEFYMDNTQARVELANASTLASATVRELQVPTAWSDTSVTVTVNRGVFGDGDSVYAYIYDSTGSANATGILLSGGGGSSPGGSMDVRNVPHQNGIARTVSVR